MNGTKRILKDSYKSLNDIKSACHDYVAKHKRNGVCIAVKTEFQPKQLVDIHFMSNNKKIHTEQVTLIGA